MKERDERIALLFEVRRTYEEAVGCEIKDVSRLHDYVEHRVALSNALRPYATTKDIGNLFNKDHSTIVHYSKEHEPMMHYYPNYAAKYMTAVKITEDLSEKAGILPIIRSSSNNIQSQIYLYLRTIAELQRRVKKMQTIIAGREANA
jgi:hypothetical protein